MSQIKLDLKDFYMTEEGILFIGRYLDCINFLSSIWG